MKNADMPANPQTYEFMRHLETYLMEDESVGAPPMESAGLTKREHFAAMAMQGMLASIDWQEDEDHWLSDEESLAAYAVSQADKLLAELESTQ